MPNRGGSAECKGSINPFFLRFAWAKHFTHMGRIGSTDCILGPPPVDFYPLQSPIAAVCMSRHVPARPIDPFSLSGCAKWYQPRISASSMHTWPGHIQPFSVSPCAVPIGGHRQRRHFGNLRWSRSWEVPLASCRRSRSYPGCAPHPALYLAGRGNEGNENL